jgi:glycine/D-amino acid oxidase-like deaminating enzyme
MSPAPPPSLWLAQAPAQSARPALPGDRDVDVAIVGAGYTGLWIAWYLKQRAPGLSIAVLEAGQAGHGASGRNGGWLMAEISGEAALLGALDGEARESARRVITGIVPEVAGFLEAQSVDCHFHAGGGLFAAARYPGQGQWLREELARYHAAGHSEADYRWLEPAELAARLRIRRPFGAIFTPHIARIQPALLALGLAQRVESQGVPIYEGTRVTGLSPGVLQTDRGRVRAAVRVLAMEGSNSDIAAWRSLLLPIQSRIVCTEPLTPEQWAEVGLAQGEVFADASPLVTYGQRSADDRLVFGGRGSYRFGGLPQADFSADGRAFARVERLLRACFPQLRELAITHRWGGNLGVARAARPHAVYDRDSGLATAGGYTGEGVGASNLMARSLVDLILDRDTELVHAPWSHRGDPRRVLRPWEPEPLRYLGYTSLGGLLAWQEHSHARGDAGWRSRLADRGVALLGGLMH